MRETTLPAGDGREPLQQGRHVVVHRRRRHRSILPNDTDNGRRGVTRGVALCDFFVRWVVERDYIGSGFADRDVVIPARGPTVRHLTSEWSAPWT
ncbi:hypothetical protein GCM10009798_11030 [Nocardioides panacihumi]|uniref:Uncharacterized protein n=1 Tax=Nocardioides panacihumi TaxID=400774 RepID=A0ABN2QJL8_9ACTN